MQTTDLHSPNNRPLCNDFHDKDIDQYNWVQTITWVSKFEECMKTKSKLLQKWRHGYLNSYPIQEWHKIQNTRWKTIQWRFFPVTSSQACNTWFTISSTPTPCFTCIHTSWTTQILTFSQGHQRFENRKTMFSLL